MSDKNTLTIDPIETEMDVATEIKKNFLEENIKLKLAVNALITKSKSLILTGVGLVLFGGFWALLSSYTEQALPGPIATLTKELVYNYSILLKPYF
jgi:nitrate/nitrite transport system permease protein